jgi:uncharacterized protein YxeA
MKKTMAILLAVVLVVALGASAFAANNYSLDQAKSIALNYVGVHPSEATFTKAHIDYEYGYTVYEFEFYAFGTEYEVDVDANTGNVLKCSTDYFDDYGCYDYYDDDYSVYCPGGVYYYYDD